MAARINPSILAADFANLERDLQSVSDADYIHVDVMDNHFVPNLTFGQQMVSRLQEVSPKPLDVHLMISDVDRWAPEFAKLGVFSVTFHAEATEHPIELARTLRKLGTRAGVAIKPGTAVDSLIDHLDEFNQFLVMTVEPGFGGQKFMEQTMAKVEAIRARIQTTDSSIWLQVDGGIDSETVKVAASHGADTFVAGSSVFSASDRNLQIRQLRQLASEANAGHTH